MLRLFYKLSVFFSRNLFLLVCCCLPLALGAQSPNATTADALLDKGAYREALDAYKTLLKKKTTPQLKYKYAYCCYKLGMTEEAIHYFQISDSKQTKRYYYLAELYVDDYQFNAAIEAYHKYLESLTETNPERLEIQDKIRRSRTALELLSRVEDISIIDSISVDKHDFLSYYHLSSDLGNFERDSISVRSQAVDRIFYMTQRRDRLYFSNENKGNLDLFHSYKLLNGWSEALPLSEQINSEANENYPFLMPDGITIYFASDGKNSIGGYDIFVSRYIPSENRYFPPENVGMPFNSPYDDYMLVIDEVNKVGWFASERNRKNNQVTIYLFVLNDAKKILNSVDSTRIRDAAKIKNFRLASELSPFAFRAKIKSSPDEGKGEQLSSEKQEPENSN